MGMLCRRNDTAQLFSSYMLDFAFHEMLMQSTHLTHDPSEADFFYVPVYASCFAWPVHGFAEFPYFFRDGVSHGPGALACPSPSSHLSNVTHIAPLVLEQTGCDLISSLPLWVRSKLSQMCTGMGWTDGRTVNGMYMYLAALRWVQQAFPFWNATGGSDHLVMATHDEGSCWVPNEWRNATLLTHWAPLAHPRESRSAWISDRYSHKYACIPHLGHCAVLSCCSHCVHKLRCVLLAM
jgi:hypothetical protein